MEQLDLQALLETSYEICQAIMKADVGQVRSEGKELKTIFRNDLVRFGTYLTQADGKVSEDEVEFVRTTLGYSNDAPVIEAMRRGSVQ